MPELLTSFLKTLDTVQQDVQQNVQQAVEQGPIVQQDSWWRKHRDGASLFTDSQNICIRNLKSRTDFLNLG